MPAVPWSPIWAYPVAYILLPETLTPINGSAPFIWNLNLTACVPPNSKETQPSSSDTLARLYEIIYGSVSGGSAVS